MVLENERGFALVCGVDPWERIYRLAPFDAVLSDYRSFSEVLCLSGFDCNKKCQIVSSLCRLLETRKPIIYPRRGFGRGRIGIIDKEGNLIAEANGWRDLAKQTGWDFRSIRNGHISGEGCRGCPVVILS